MSDGGISMASAWGYTEVELARPILVKPNWLESLRESRKVLVESLYRSLKNPHPFGSSKVTSARPNISDIGIEPFIEKVCKDEDVFPNWHWDKDVAVYAIHHWNNSVNNIWFWQMGMRDQIPRTARERRKLGYTKQLTPAEWLEVRGEMKRYRIARSAITTDIYAEEVESLMAFLTRGELPDGMSMDARKPKLNHRIAGNIVWFIQQVLGWIDADDIDICTDCGTVIQTDSQTHDWCSKCGKMRCESCTTAPYHCECDYPCGKHCKCKERD